MRAHSHCIHALTLFLLLSAADIAWGDQLVVAAGVTSYVNVRESPTASAPKVGELRPGERATLLESAGNWWKIRLAGGVVGYVKAEWTRVTQAGDFEHGEDAFDRGDYREALRIWQPLAETGDARAQFGLGNLYFNGHGVESNQAAATEWYRKSALQGHAPAQFNLGNAYKHGRGVPKNERLANEWWERAAEQGLASAQYNLGLQYYFGVGIEENRETATRWFALAAEQGHPKALTLFDARPGSENKPTGSSGNQRQAGKSPVAANEFESWIAKQPPDAFTIQILATRDTQSLQRFIDRSRFNDPVAWFRFEKSGETWYALVHGTYASRRQAQAAAANLQQGVNENQLWVRRFGDIHAAMATR